MTDTILAIYPDALDCGISLDVFWGSSVQEVIDMMESNYRLRKAHLKEEIVLRFAEADAIGSRIAYIFGGKGRKKSDVLMAHEVFPELFEEEKERIDRAEEKRAVEVHKAQMMAFAARWNKRQSTNSDSEYSEE